MGERTETCYFTILGEVVDSHQLQRLGNNCHEGCLLVRFDGQKRGAKKALIKAEVDEGVEL